MSAVIADAFVDKLQTEQASYALELVRVLRRADLPLLVWTVFPSGLAGRAFGATDDETKRMVRAWAKAFGTHAVVESQPEIVEHRTARSTGWRLEPGRITARLSDGVTVFGELVEATGGVL